MAALINAVLREVARHQKAGLANPSIPFRPDYDQKILSDLGANCSASPFMGTATSLSDIERSATSLSDTEARGNKPVS